MRQLAGRNRADSDATNEERGDAEKEECLARVAALKIAVGEWHHDQRRCAIQIMDVAFGAEAIGKDDSTEDDLDRDQNLTDDHRPGDAPAEHSATNKGVDTPQPDREHEEDDRRREPVMDRDHRIQRQSLSKITRCRLPAMPQPSEV